MSTRYMVYHVILCIKLNPGVLAIILF